MITPLLADAVHDYWEINSFKAAVFGAICTGLWAVWQWQKDYRWRQVELARKLLDDIFDYPPSDDAWKMVDGETSFNDSEEHEEEGKIKITMADVKRALKVTVADDKRTLPDSKNDDELRKDKYVRWCFDALFYYLERL